MWKKLLVPHDFSACAERALRTAVELAKVHGASLVLAHVSSLPANLPPSALISPADSPEPLRVDEYTTRGARQRLEDIAAPLRKLGLVVATFAVTGEVTAQIITLARQVEADALVVGTHGRTGLSHLLLGSVAEKIVRAATVPVVCVRTSAPEAAPTREESSAEDELSG